jgi:hypothetical protein
MALRLRCGYVYSHHNLPYFPPSPLAVPLPTGIKMNQWDKYPMCSLILLSFPPTAYTHNYGILVKWSWKLEIGYKLYVVTIKAYNICITFDCTRKSHMLSEFKHVSFHSSSTVYAIFLTVIHFLYFRLYEYSVIISLVSIHRLVSVMETCNVLYEVITAFQASDIYAGHIRYAMWPWGAMKRVNRDRDLRNEAVEAS